MGTVELSSLPVSDQLGRGGFAKVADLPGWLLPGESGPFVLKRYHPAVVAKYPGIGPALTALIGLRVAMSADDRRTLDARVIWPLAAVTAGEEVVGLVMRRIPARFFFDMVMSRGDRKRMVRTADMYFCAPKSSAENGLPPFELADRVMLFARFGQQLSFLHRQGVTVGDIQGGNVAVDPNNGGKGGPRLHMYDSDSYRIRGSVPAVPQPHAMSWEPPELRSLRMAARRLPDRDPQRAMYEAQARVQSQHTDVYKYGLFGLRLLSLRDGVSVSTDPSAALALLRNPAVLGTRRAQLLAAAIAPNPAQRPTMLEFMRSLAA